MHAIATKQQAHNDDINHQQLRLAPFPRARTASSSTALRDSKMYWRLASRKQIEIVSDKWNKLASSQPSVRATESYISLKQRNITLTGLHVPRTLSTPYNRSDVQNYNSTQMQFILLQFILSHPPICNFSGKSMLNVIGWVLPKF